MTENTSKKKTACGAFENTGQQGRSTPASRRTASRQNGPESPHRRHPASTFLGLFAAISLGIASSIGLSGILYAQGIDPANKFKKEIERKYKKLPPPTVKAFLDLPWPTVYLSHVEKTYTNLALEAAWVLGDFKPLIEGTGDGGLVLQRGVRLLKGPFADFWRCFDSDARRLLMSSPQDFKQTLSILESFEKESNSDKYKLFVAKHPDLLVFLYRFPALLSIDENRLALTTDFLRSVDLGTTNRVDINRLNCTLEKSLDRLLNLYLIGPGIGEAAALTYWGTPELFPSNGDTAKTLSEDRTAWAAIASQLPFILEMRLQSKDWKTDREKLRGILYRNSTQIGSEVWRDLLVQTPDDKGVVLRMLWKMTNSATPTNYFNALDDLLNRWKDWDLPLAPMVRLFQAAETPGDMSRLCRICASTAKTGTNQTAVPIGLVAILEFGEDKEFMKLLRHHDIKLIAYLFESQSGGVADPAARFEVAKQTDLKDVTYDQSQLHSILQSIPLGNAADVGMKWAKGYPVAKADYLFAAMDVVSVLGPVTVLRPAASAAKAAGQTLLKTALKTVTKHSIEISYAVKQSGLDTKAQELERAYSSEAQKSSVAKMQKDIRVAFEAPCWTNAFRLNWLVSRSGLPLAERNRTLSRENAAHQTITCSFPAKFDDWCLSTSDGDGKHSILIVTLGDLSR